jgi:plastocyanin
MEETPTPALSAGRQFVLRLVGAGLLAATAAIHLDLYLTGYRHIPTIGWLFLLQIIVAFVLAAAVLVLRNPLVAASGSLFALSTLGGYLLTLWVGLFGFQEVRTTAGIVAGILEVLAFGILGYAALAGLTGRAAISAHAGRAGRTSPALVALATMAGLTVVAAVVLGASVGTASSANSSSSSSASAPAGSGPVLKITIKNFMFTPDNPSVKPGEKIEVTNEDSITHTFTAGPGSKDKGLFTTGDVGPNQTKIVTAPKTAGMYAFYCTIHTFMTGMLIVGK